MNAPLRVVALAAVLRAVAEELLAQATPDRAGFEQVRGLIDEELAAIPAAEGPP